MRGHESVSAVLDLSDRRRIGFWDLRKARLLQCFGLMVYVQFGREISVTRWYPKGSHITMMERTAMYIPSGSRPWHGELTLYIRRNILADATLHISTVIYPQQTRL